MTPVDYRNETFEGIRARVSHLRLAVYQELQSMGPSTTRELARKSGMDILTVRPRVTELIDLGWVVLATDRPGNEGIYRALSEVEARALFAQRRAAAGPVQTELALN